MGWHLNLPMRFVVNVGWYFARFIWRSQLASRYFFLGYSSLACGVGSLGVIISVYVQSKNSNIYYLDDIVGFSIAALLMGYGIRWGHLYLIRWIHWNSIRDKNKEQHFMAFHIVDGSIMNYPTSETTSFKTSHNKTFVCFNGIFSGVFHGNK